MTKRVSLYSLGNTPLNPDMDLRTHIKWLKSIMAKVPKQHRKDVKVSITTPPQFHTIGGVACHNGHPPLKYEVFYDREENDNELQARLQKEAKAIDVEKLRELANSLGYYIESKDWED
jgi:hypothetical protein